MEIERGEAETLLTRARNETAANAERLAELKAALAEIEALKARQMGLARLIEGLEMLHPPKPAAAPIEMDLGRQRPAPGGETIDEVIDAAVQRERRRRESGAPTATDAALSILRQNSDEWFTGRTMIRMFSDHQIDATPTAIRLALKRHAERGVADFRESEDGTHMFRIHRDGRDADDASSTEVSTS